MADAGNLNQSINKAQRHYSSMFFLPSLKKALLSLFCVCLLSGMAISLVPGYQNGLIWGLFLSITFFVLTYITDFILSNYLLKNPIFNLRRNLVLSLASWLFWFVFIAIGGVLTYFINNIWLMRFCLFGFSIVITLRTIVYFATLTVNPYKRFVAILLQPLASLAPFVILWSTFNTLSITYLLILAILPIIAISFGYFFLHLLDKVGKKNYNLAALPLFRAFILNWVTGENAPLEKFLEQLGEDADVNVSLLKFDSQKTTAAIILPLVHPGPFKNIGSSILPSLLKHAFEKKYECTACVPLGLLGHERNAASQIQNNKIINKILNDATFEAKDKTATPFVQIQKGSITTSCQLFGKTAVLSFTLAPKTTEDLPQALDSIVSAEAKKLGLDNSILINTHNSLTSSNEIDASLDELKEAAFESLNKAIAQSSSSFKIGAATIYPKEFTLKEGMGEGGITAIVVQVGEQKAAYVVIDGNNMISGLREKIITELKASGIDESEVFTTDTHSVSAIVRGQRGYHPVGEVMSHDILLLHFKDVVQKAKNQLEESKAGFTHILVPKVRVMGESSLEPLTVIVDKSIQKAKQIVAPIFLTEAILLLLLLSFM